MIINLYLLIEKFHQFLFLLRNRKVVCVQGILEIFSRFWGRNYRRGAKIPISSIISVADNIWLDCADAYGKSLFAAQRKLDASTLVESLSNGCGEALADRGNSISICRLQSLGAHFGLVHKPF